jgi:hypothetical protein
MPDTIQTFGDFGGYTLTLQRRTRKPEDAIQGLSYGVTVQALTLIKGATVIELGLAEDNAPYSDQALVKGGKLLIDGFAAIGAQVVLGDRTAPLPASGTTGASGPYTRSVTLTPGTPLPPGRGVLVKGVGAFALKLAGGGAMNVGDATGGSGTKFDGVSVVDATLSKSTDTVQILY